MNKLWRILLTFIMIASFAIALSYPIGKWAMDRDAEMSMAQIIAMRDTALESQRILPGAQESDEDTAQETQETDEEAADPEKQETSAFLNQEAKLADGEEAVAESAFAPEPTAGKSATEPPATVTETVVPEEPAPDHTVVSQAEATEARQTEVAQIPQAEVMRTRQAEATEIPQAEVTEMPQAEATEIPQAEVTEIPQAGATETLAPMESSVTSPGPTPTPSPILMPSPTPTPSPTPAPTINRFEREKGLPYPQKEKQLLDTDKILEQYRDLYDLNHDMVGWITIPGTNVDYPVLQNKDNEFYLTHDFMKSENKNGQIILDSKCDPYTPSYNLVISGHNMRSDKMFSKLDDYHSKSYWRKHKIVLFDTLMEQKQYVVMAAFYAADYDVDEKGFRYNVDIQYGLDLRSWLEEVRDYQLYDTDVDAEFGDEFLTLTTCNRTRRKNGRFVVVCRRIREGEEWE